GHGVMRMRAAAGQLTRWEMGSPVHPRHAPRQAGAGGTGGSSERMVMSLLAARKKLELLCCEGHDRKPALPDQRRFFEEFVALDLCQCNGLRNLLPGFDSYFWISGIACIH